jgi:histone-lysine N-methyltransferase SETD3
MAQAAYKNYPTTYEEDLEILKRDDLTKNQRNCVLLRAGEKEILLFYINIAGKFTLLLDMDVQTAMMHA